MYWEFWCDFVILIINEFVFKVKCCNFNFLFWIFKDFVKVIKKKKILWKKVRKIIDVLF